MTTSTEKTTVTCRRRGINGAGSVLAVTLACLGAALVINRAGPSDATTNSVATRLPLSADAAEQWVTPHRDQGSAPCGPDAAQRWQVPNIAPADLPLTADAAEAWRTPEIAVADLPVSADAAEQWLCEAR